MFYKILNKENFLVYLFAFIFITINTILIANEVFIAIIIPFALVIALLAFLSLDKLFYIAVFFTPLSLSISYLFDDFGVNLFLPSEPLLIGISIIYILKVLIEKKIEKKLILHPVSISIYFYVFWLIITTITSSMPIVSIKFLISKLWFIIPVFFMGTQIFENKSKMKTFVWAYLISLLIVISYTTIRHITIGFLDMQTAHFVMQPFYNDHTAYGAILALVIPLVIGFLFKVNYKKSIKIFIAIILLILFVALVLSYSRAAWISLLGALGIWIVVKLKIKFSILFFTFCILVALFFTFRFEIIDKLEKNKQDSSEQLSEQVKSISNIATDASNLERLNRWNSAFKMFHERPFFGWGPGTYMFQYAPFQKADDRTIISTDFGTRGNAHSEYIGPLAEAGVLGTLTFILIIVTTIFTAIKVHRKTNDKELSMLSLAAMLGLITYYVHGLLNNFLDTDKLSIPFWGLMAIIVAIDVFHNQTYKKQN